MAVKIRLTRKGKKGKPFYRVVATDERFSRDGRYLEVVGTYSPTANDDQVSLKMDRIDYWKGQGAILSDTVTTLVKEQQA